MTEDLKEFGSPRSVDDLLCPGDRVLGEQILGERYDPQRVPRLKNELCALNTSVKYERRIN